MARYTYENQPDAENLWYQINNVWRDPNRVSTLLNQFGDTFASNFQNETGRAPTPDEINTYFKQAVAPIMNTATGFGGQDYNSVNQLAQSYIPTNYGGDIRAYQQKQAQDQMNTLNQQQNQQLESNLGTLKGLLPGMQENLVNQFTTGGGLDALKSQMNNLGLLNSGAFNQALGQTIGSSASDLQNQMLQSLIGPALGQMQGNPQQAFNLGSGASSGYQNLGLQGQGGIGARNNELYDFNLQTDLAKKLSEMMEPSGFEKNLGYAKTASSIMGNVGGMMPVGSGAGPTSYVCLELVKRGLLCEMDLDDLHVHLLPAMFQKGRAFWHYAMKGKALVEAANRAGVDWAAMKPLLFDRVMRESDAVKATDCYAYGCYQLALQSDPTLWDPAVLRAGLLDSLPFLPRLLAYRPFRKALAKVIRLKTLVLYDRPRCEVHYGA